MRLQSLWMMLFTTVSLTKWRLFLLPLLGVVFVCWFSCFAFSIFLSPNSLVDGGGSGLEDDEVCGLSGIKVLKYKTPFGERSPVQLTLVFREERHLWRCGGVGLGDPREHRTTQARVACRRLPASSVHLPGTLSQFHHVVILSLEFLLVVVTVGFEIPDNLMKGFGSLHETGVVETLDAEGNDSRQDDVTLLHVHLLFGFLRILFIAEDVAQLGSKDPDRAPLSFGNDGESILINVTGWRIFCETTRFLLRRFLLNNFFRRLLLGRWWWRWSRLLWWFRFWFRFRFLFLFFLNLLNFLLNLDFAGKAIRNEENVLADCVSYKTIF
jgi:hypothetical protein